MLDRGLTIAQAALALGLGYNVVLRLVLTHQLEGWQNKTSHWRVSEKSVERFRREIERGQATAPVPA